MLQVTIRLGNPNPSTPAASYGLDLEHGNKFDSNSINPRVTVATYKSLKCWYTNADSLSNKFCELKSRLSIDKPDIVAITEVNCKFADNNVEFNIDGYKTIQNTTHHRLYMNLFTLVWQTLRAFKVRRSSKRTFAC